MARILFKTSGAASAVQPPKLCPTIPNLSEIQPGFRVPHSAIEYAIEEKANIRHTARNRCFRFAQLFCSPVSPSVRFSFLRHDLRVI